jgi:hypothetical protein
MKIKAIKVNETTDAEDKKMLSRWLQKEKKIKSINKMNITYG